MTSDDEARVAAVWTLTFVKVIGEIWKIALCPCPVHVKARESRR